MARSVLVLFASACWTHDPPPEPPTVQPVSLDGEHGTYALAATGSPAHGTLPSCGEPARTCLDIAQLNVRFEATGRVYVNERHWPVEHFPTRSSEGIVAWYPSSTPQFECGLRFWHREARATGQLFVIAIADRKATCLDTVSLAGQFHR